MRRQPDRRMRLSATRFAFGLKRESVRLQANTQTTYEYRAKLLDPLMSVRIDTLTTRSIRDSANKV